MTAWLLLYSPIFNVDNEFCALEIFVVSSTANVLFWRRGAPSELGFSTTLLGRPLAMRCAKLCFVWAWWFQKKDFRCEALHLASFLLFLGVLFFALLLLRLFALRCVYHLHWCPRLLCQGLFRLIVYALVLANTKNLSSPAYSTWYITSVGRIRPGPIPLAKQRTIWSGSSLDL